jgi:single-strand selective monofunctional uracil DNA glycosylase
MSAAGPRKNDASSNPLVRASRALTRRLTPLAFSPPVAHVYNPLVYARESHEQYLQRYGRGRRRVVFLGMNPGPWGMAQTGVPFGEVAAVRDWMGIQCPVKKPENEHPKRPVEGFDCPRSEVSGRRLWGLMADRFGSAPAFFADHFVVNYCPLTFMRDSGANLTPDKLPAAEMLPVHEACDAYLRVVIQAMRPRWLIGVGGFAEARCQAVTAGLGLVDIRVGRILHPSPASPAANRDWTGSATRQLMDLGVW